MSSPTWLDPIITKPDVFYSLQYMRGDDTDDTAGFQAMLAAVRMNGGGHIVMQRPPKRYRFEATGNGYPGDDFPSNTEISGEPGAEVFWVGAAKEGDLGNKARTGRYGWLAIHPGSFAILIRDLVVRSDNTPFARYYNNQSSSILIDPPKPLCRDITVRDCEFLDHVGFPVHAPGGGNRLHTLRNTYRNCANGENVGGDYSVHYGNRFINTEGLEAAAAFSVFAFNDFSQASVKGSAMSIGGETSPGKRRAGTLVIGNTVRNSLGLGILIAEGCVSGWIQGNVVDGAGDSAIQIGTVHKAYCDHHSVIGNLCTGARFGINVLSPFATDTLVADNTCIDDAFGLRCASGRATVVDNVFSGRIHDVSFKVADGTMFMRNSLRNNRLEVIGSAAFRPNGMPSTVEIGFYGAIDEGLVNVHIKNWSLGPEVNLDLNGILQRGEHYAVYHPYNLLGEPLVAAVFDGSPISLPTRQVEASADWKFSTRSKPPAMGGMFLALVLSSTR